MSDRRYVPLSDLLIRYRVRKVDTLERRFRAAGITVYNISGDPDHRKLAVAETDIDALAHPVTRRGAARPTFNREPTQAEILARLGLRA